MMPMKKLSPEVLAEIRDREEESKKVVKPINMAEERVKNREENERRIMKEEYKRKEDVMKEIKEPKCEIVGAMYEEMRAFIKKHGKRMFFKFYLTTAAGENNLIKEKFLVKRPLIDDLKFKNMYD